MGPIRMPLEDKLGLLPQLLASADLRAKRVLDADSGRGSARVILERHAAEIMLVGVPGDVLRATRAHTEGFCSAWGRPDKELRNEENLARG